MLFQVLSNVVFKCDGQVFVKRYHVDLDYFTIREWRSLYLDFYNFNKEHIDKYCVMSIEPVDGIVWK